jgi:hypothetical protein
MFIWCDRTPPPMSAGGGIGVGQDDWRNTPIPLSAHAQWQQVPQYGYGGVSYFNSSIHAVVPPSIPSIPSM